MYSKILPVLISAAQRLEAQPITGPTFSDLTNVGILAVFGALILAGVVVLIA